MSVAAVRAPAGREEWLAWRRQGIGGSDAPAVVGLSPFKSPVSLWLDKTGQLEEQEPHERMVWGSLLEDIVADEFERRAGVTIADRQSWREHPEHPWMRATIDGYVVRDGEVLGIFEGKTTAWAREWENGPPVHVVLQVQHQLAVTDQRMAWVVVLLNGNELRWFEVERDEETIAELIRLESAFWHTCVLAGVPPAVDGSEVTSEAIAQAFAEPLPNSAVDLPAQAAELVAEYHLAAAAEKAAGQQKQEAANGLRLLLGDAQVGLLDGQKVVTWAEVKSKALDQDRLKTEAPDVFARFVSERSSRRLTVHRDKEEEKS